MTYLAPIGPDVAAFLEAERFTAEDFQAGDGSMIGGIGPVEIAAQITGLRTNADFYLDQDTRFDSLRDLAANASVTGNASAGGSAVDPSTAEQGIGTVAEPLRARAMPPNAPNDAADDAVTSARTDIRTSAQNAGEAIPVGSADPGEQLEVDVQTEPDAPGTNETSEGEVETPGQTVSGPPGDGDPAPVGESSFDADVIGEYLPASETGPAALITPDQTAMLDPVEADDGAIGAISGPGSDGDEGAVEEPEENAPDDVALDGGNDGDGIPEENDGDDSGDTTAGD
ncbi:hypothetical protein LX81_03771, partial [Palleronia aestuarii]